MNDKGIAVLEQYGIQVNKSSRAKGAFLLDTDKGYYLIKEFRGTVKHLELEEKLLKAVRDNSSLYVDYPVRNEAGKLISDDVDGTKYILKKWYIARDCEVRNIQMLYKAVSALAVFHNTSAEFMKMEDKDNPESNFDGVKIISEEFERHNRELRRCRNFIRRKNQKNEFELMVLSSFNQFYDRAAALTSECNVEAYVKMAEEAARKGSMVHGAFNYHNILFSDDKAFITNFEHCKPDIQVKDLYDFLRKVMEKHGWNRELGHKLIAQYSKIRTISDTELNFLRICLSYPEKYWKILSHYYNNGKAWIPDKDIEKLKTVIRQDGDRETFIRSLQ